MKLLKELLNIAAIAETKEPFVGMLPIKSFVAGNMIMHNRTDGDGDDDEDGAETKEKKPTKKVEEGKDMKIVVKTPKPRAAEVNQALMGTKPGRHHDPKKDYVRAKEKDKARKSQD